MGFPFLPDMWIRADAEVPVFLSRLKDLSQQLPHVGIEYQKRIGKSKELSVLTLVPTGPDVPEGLRIVLSSSKKQKNNHIFVETKASGWSEPYPEYEEYTALTKRFIDPLLRAYNKFYRSNRRLYVQTQTQLTPKLSQYPAKLFDYFTTNANKSFLGRRSWRDFYKFIICCHRRNEYVSSDELKFLLRQVGFEEYYCEKLYMIFEHGWEILEELPDSKLKAWRRRIREQERKERQTWHG
jgi:hypothetical protein